MRPLFLPWWIVSMRIWIMRMACSTFQTPTAIASTMQRKICENSPKNGSMESSTKGNSMVRLRAFSMFSITTSCLRNNATHSPVIVHICGECAKLTSVTRSSERHARLQRPAGSPKLVVRRRAARLKRCRETVYADNTQCGLVCHDLPLSVLRNSPKRRPALMSDESQLQLRAKDGDSSLVLSSARSSLVARGRREAAMLTAPVEAESEEHRSEIYYFSDVPLFEKRPIEQLREDAEKGDAKQQSLLAYAYRHGPGGRDLAESARWYRKAADQGNAYAQNTLGLIYDRGEGVAQDYVEAIKWYRKAADKGFEPAYFNLGVKYDNGQGVAQNFTEAVSRMLKKILGEGF